MNSEQYDEIVIKIHKLYEEMYSVQERESGQLGRSWRIFLTLGGVITHGTDIFIYHPLDRIAGNASGKIVKSLRRGLGLHRRDIYLIVAQYIVEVYFGGNIDLFKDVRYRFLKDYHQAGQHLDEYINAANTGRTIPIERLIAHYIKMDKIRHNKWYKAFFKHSTFREYVEKAVEYFEGKNINLRQVALQADGKGF